MEIIGSRGCCLFVSFPMNCRHVCQWLKKTLLLPVAFVVSLIIIIQLNELMDFSTSPFSLFSTADLNDKNESSFSGFPHVVDERIKTTDVSVRFNGNSGAEIIYASPGIKSIAETSESRSFKGTPSDSENTSMIAKFETHSSPPWSPSEDFPSVVESSTNSTFPGPNSSFHEDFNASSLDPVDEEEAEIPALLSTTTDSHKSRQLSNLTISRMNELLLHTLSFPKSMNPRWSSPADKELVQAKSQILGATSSSYDPHLDPSLYRNISMFTRSYELMEKMLKVYIYKDGERPIFHEPVIQGIYASEGWFMKLLTASKKYVTKSPRQAHLFYLPYSSKKLEQKLYVQDSHSLDNLIQYMKNYTRKLSSNHPFWNRTNGADHFLVACHDWAPRETVSHMSNCIRALCNSDVNEGFVFGRDVSLPETRVRSPKHLQRGLGGKPASQRSILAFFAGAMHGYVRPLLLKQWGGGVDPDMKIYTRIPKTKRRMSYAEHMKSSKYCICAKGYEVNSPRVVEAIFYECVPVIISDNFVPPLFSVLKWESFAVFVLEKDIPNLKNILVSIPHHRYLKLQMAVKRVQRHFVWHSKPVKYDLFHMILHSIWFNRLFAT